MNCQEPLAKLGNTAIGLHDKIIELLDEESRGSILDAPAGEGRLSYLLQKMGFKVTAGDIDASVFKIPDMRFKLLDLNNTLPFEPATFDYVTCIEGIEHIENSFHLLRELARILKIGGKLILSTPNILSIHSRLRFLLQGHFAFFGGYFSNENNFYTYHINPAGFPQLQMALYKSGFIIEKIASNRSIYEGKPLLLNLIIKILSAFTSIVTKQRERDAVLKDYFISKELLLGEIIVIKCVKKR